MPKWEHDFSLRTGAGYRDNVGLASQSPKESAFIATGLEMIFLRLRQTEGIDYDDVVRLCGAGGMEWIERGLSDGWLRRDGARVAFAWLREGRWHLHELDMANGTVRPLVNARGDERGPRYSPDGGRLVFSRRSGGWDAIWIRDLSTGREQRVSYSTGNDNQPTWGADGRSVYFASDRGRGIFMPAVYRLQLPWLR